MSGLVGPDVRAFRRRRMSGLGGRISGLEWWHLRLSGSKGPDFRAGGQMSGGSGEADVRAAGAGCPSPVASGGCAAVEDDAPGAGCPGPGRCSWLLPLVLLIRGLGDLYIFMRIFGRALLVPNHAQHLGLR